MEEHIKKTYDMILSNIKGFSLTRVQDLAPAELYNNDPVKAICYAMRQSGEFNTDDYLYMYPDVRQSGMDAIDHYVRFGIHELRILKHLPRNDGTGKVRMLNQGCLEGLYDMPLQVDWLLTDMCNYKCSYCWGHAPLDKARFTSFKQLKHAVDVLYSLNRPSYTLTLSGGEPTTHPCIFDLIEYCVEVLANRIDSIGIISNGSRQGNLYEKLAKVSSRAKFNLGFSLHTEFLDTEHIYELVELLSFKVSLLLRLMINPKRMSVVKEIFEKLCKLREKYPFIMDFVMIKRGNNFTKLDDAYTEDDFKWISDAKKIYHQVTQESKVKASWNSSYPYTYFREYDDGYKTLYEIYTNYDNGDFYKKGFIDYKGMWCCLGTSTIAIMRDGRIRGAECDVAPLKYNIYEDNPFLTNDFIECIKCTRDNCGCGLNQKIAKFIKKEDAENYIMMYKRKQKFAMANIPVNFYKNVFPNTVIS